MVPRSAALLTLLVSLTLVSPAATAAPVPRGVVVYQRDALLEGIHVRLNLPPGVVHLWQPPGYDPATAGLVVYVHGFGSSADRAWRGSHLARQFLASRRNALFVVPDSPSGAGQRLAWPRLSELLAVVARTDLALPEAGAHVVLVGHSSGHRTVARWIADPAVAEVLLLDGFASQRRVFASWLRRSLAHRLVLVGARANGPARAWLQQLSPRLARRARDTVPRQLSGPEASVAVLYLRSQYGHVQMVRGQQVIPLLVNQSRL
ncbi:MAG: hypothetical protein KKF52_05625, partial [Nanoarchaeota archaeon]|nr:hypothetical protein [Nanoarchaeota archaeon]